MNTDRRMFKRKSECAAEAIINFDLMWPKTKQKSSSFKASVLNLSEGGVCARIIKGQENQLDRWDLEEMDGIELRLPKVFGATRIRGKKAWVSWLDEEPKIGIRLEYCNGDGGNVRELLHSYLSRPSAARYTIGLYGVEWERAFPESLLGILRDALVLLLPFRLPHFFIRMLYGIRPKFVFYVHPRRKEDIFISFPPLKYLRNLLSSKRLLWLASMLPPFVIGKIRHPNIDGVVIATLQMPNQLVANIKYSIRKARGAVCLAGKICPPGGIMGLGGWWPIVTRRGVSLRTVGRRYNIQITNGHCGTLVSIYLMVAKIARISGLKMDQLHIGVIGSGKMGRNVASVLNGRVNKLTLIDMSRKKLENVARTLQLSENASVLETAWVHPSEQSRLRHILQRPHLLICTTSNVRKLFVSGFLPDKFVVIDDSRPEAFFRTDPLLGKIVLEGGLMSLDGVNINYDFGFGVDENIFGCLAENFCLALDQGRTLKPTIGDVDLDNFWQMLKFCEQRGILVGDFKSGMYVVDDEIISRIIREKQNDELPAA